MYRNVMCRTYVRYVTVHYRSKCTDQRYVTVFYITLRYVRVENTHYGVVRRRTRTCTRHSTYTSVRRRTVSYAV